MKKAYLISLTIFAYFFATSCDDAVNSDDNLYKVPDGDYSILYSTMDEKNNTGTIYQSDLNGNKSIWKDSVIFMDHAINNNLLLWYPIDMSDGIYKYSIYNFDNNTNKALFNNENTNLYTKLITEDQVLMCKGFFDTGDLGECFVRNINNNSQYSIAKSTLLASTLSSPDGKNISFLDFEEEKYCLINSDGTNKKYILNSEDDIPSSWTHNSKEMLIFQYWHSDLHNSWIIKLNPISNQIDTLRKFAREIAFPKFSNNNKKIAFVLYPDGIATMNSDGTDYKILREPSQGDGVDMLPNFEWSPNDRYILYKRLYSEESGDTFDTGLEMIDTQTGKYYVIENSTIVFTATWIEK